MKQYKQAGKFALLFAIFALHSTAFTAPKIPERLLNNSLVYCTNATGFSFNPQKAEAGTNMNVVTAQIYDKLLEFEHQSNSLKPALAERFDVSNDGQIIYLYLRKNVRFQQTAWFTPSRDFNAEDVIFSLNRVMNRKEALSEFDEAQQQNQRDELAERTHFPYFESINLDKTIKRISAPDLFTVKIELNYPDSSLLAHLSSPYAVILSQEYALQLNADDNLAQLDILPVGTGVYQLESYEQGEFVRLKPNAYYWGKKANIDNMIVDFSTTGTGRMAKFLNNECDISAFPELSQLSILSDEKGYLVENQGANLAFLAFNMQRETVQDLNLRQYIAKAINRHRLARILFYGKADVPHNVLPKALMQDQPNMQPSLAVTKPTMPTLELWVIDESRVYHLHPLKMAEFIRMELARSGINVRVKQVSRAYLVKALEQGKADYDLILSGWLAHNFDPDSFLSPILSCQAQSSVTNLANWCDAQFEQLLYQARATEDPTQREQLYQQAQQRLQEILPIIPLVSVNRLLVVNNEVENVQISPFGEVKLSEIKVKF